MAEEHNNNNEAVTSSAMGDDSPQSSFEPGQPTQQQERMLPQSEVNRLIGRAKAEAAEKASQRFQQQGQSQTSNQPTVNTDDLFNRFNQTVEQKVNSKFDEWQKQQQEASQLQEQEQLYKNAKTIADEFDRKMAEVEKAGKYEDFSDVVKGINYQDPKVAGLALTMAEYDNAGDMFYRLANEPLKMYQLAEMVANQPQLLGRELKRLSDSVKQNDEARNQPRANAPLSQLKTSNNVGSGGDDWEALRNSSYLRG